MELHIVERGVCLKDGKVFASGMVWGEDMILSNPRLRMTAPATTLTYVDVQSLSKHALTMIMKKFPARAKKVRRAALWIAMRRLLIIWAFEHRLKGGKDGTLQGATGTVAAEDAKLVRVCCVGFHACGNVTNTKACFATLATACEGEQVGLPDTVGHTRLRRDRSKPR